MTSVSEDRQASFSPGLAWKVPARLATTAALVYQFNGLQAIDGVVPSAGDRILVKNQVDQTQNGVWVANTGVWTRDSDFDGIRDVTRGTVIAVLDGATLAATFWQQTTASPNPGNTTLTFAEVFTSALLPVPIVAGEIFFGGAGNNLLQDTGLVWNNTSKRLGVGVAVPSQAIDVLGSGKFSSSIIVPLIQAPAGSTLALAANGHAVDWAIQTNGALFPNADAVQNIGGPSNRILSTITAIVDSGGTTPLSLRVNAVEQVKIASAANAVNYIQLVGAATTLTPVITTGGFDTNIALQYGTKGNLGHTFFTDNAGALPVQFQILHTAGATRNITVTGSSGSPTMSTTAGDLALNAATGTIELLAEPHISAGNNLVVLGTGSLKSMAVECVVINAVQGIGLLAATAGVQWTARSAAGLPSLSDIPSTEATVWKDTSGGSVKLYYNDAGTLKSVALT